MAKHFKGDEDPLHEMDIREIEVLVYRPEFKPFNAWDDRVAPDPLAKVSDIDAVSCAYLAESTQMTNYVLGAAKAVGIELPKHAATMPEPSNVVEGMWKSASVYTRRMKALRARMNTVVKHIAKSPSPLEAYDTPEFLNIGRYFGEVYEIAFEQKVLHGRMSSLYMTIMGELTKDEEDYELSDKLDAYRKEAYSEVARKLKQARTEARYKLNASVEDV